MSLAIEIINQAPVSYLEAIWKRKSPPKHFCKSFLRRNTADGCSRVSCTAQHLQCTAKKGKTFDFRCHEVLKASPSPFKGSYPQIETFSLDSQECSQLECSSWVFTLPRAGLSDFLKIWKFYESCRTLKNRLELPHFSLMEIVLLWNWHSWSGSIDSLGFLLYDVLDGNTCFIRFFFDWADWFDL